MPFKNRVRLRFHLNKPQYPETRNVYRRADGKTIVQSVVIRKEYQGSTDWWPEIVHERFKIALAHDITTVEADVYIGDISQDGDYNIGWPENNYPAAPATFKAEVSPFSATNSNCQTCEEATQLELVDDTFPDPLDEGSMNVINAIANDSICCYPVTFDIRYYNPDVVESCVISESGVVTIVLKTPLASANGLKLATYRATCSNGGYDEADIFGDINGSTESCLAPTDVAINTIMNDGARAVWNEPATPPALGYHWQLFRADNPGAPFLEGDAVGLTVLFSADLDPGTEYIFYVQSKCDADTVSNYISVDFSTTQSGGSNSTCGRYKVQYANPEEPNNVYIVTYTDCNGNSSNATIFNNGTFRYVCAMENSPGNPISIVVEGNPAFVFYEYVEPC